LRAASHTPEFPFPPVFCRICSPPSDDYVGGLLYDRARMDRIAAMGSIG
jgi:hypothetical protein